MKTLCSCNLCAEIYIATTLICRKCAHTVTWEVSLGAILRAEDIPTYCLHCHKTTNFALEALDEGEMEKRIQDAFSFPDDDDDDDFADVDG